MMKQSLWALAAAALFSVMAAFVKLCSDVHGPIEMVFYRSLFGVLVISLFVFRNRATLTLKTPHIAGHIKRSVLGTLSIMLWFFTLGKMHFGTNMTLIYTTPLFMAANFVILALMRHKPAPWALVLATIAGFTGVTIVLQPSFNEGELIPALICLGVSLLDLVIYWQMKELGDMKEPSWRIVFYFTCPTPKASSAFSAWACAPRSARSARPAPTPTATCSSPRVWASPRFRSRSSSASSGSARA